MKRSILLVEDNPHDVLLTQRAFRRANIANELHLARDGQEAIEHLSDPARELPALVLLDLQLPKVEGLEVLRWIREERHTARLPVVILTTSNEERDLVRSYDLGANSFIRKPVDFEQFSDAIRTLGLYWLVLNEPPPTP